MTTEEFIAALEENQTIDADLARQMRSKAEDGGARVTPEAILKFLVKTDVITAWKGEELAAMLLTASSAVEEPEILDLQPLPEGEEEDQPRRRSSSSMPPIETTGPPPGPFGGPLGEGANPPLFSSKASRLSDPPRDAIGAASAAEGKRTPGSNRLGSGTKKKGTKKRTAGGKNQWDSPLLLLGGGALAVLLVGGAALYYLLIRESADAVLADAKNLFDSGAYRQASVRYDEFVDTFPRHKDVSEARVRGEMAKLWEAVETNPATALPEAKRVIAEIEDEQAFASGGEGQDGPSTAKQELGAIFVRIGKALVEEAETSTEQEKLATTIEHLGDVLELSANNKYVPEKVRNDAELAAIADSLEVIRSRQQRDKQLADALAKMSAAIAASDTATAYKERLTLLADYPALADDAALQEKVREASAAEQARVKFVPGDAKALPEWPTRAVVAEIALAERLRGGSASSSTPDDPVVLRVDGALYGLSSGNGAVLWRRFAGLGAAAAPLMVDGDVVAADLGGGELWRLHGATGKLVWRLPLGDEITGIVSAGSRLLATGASGKLYVVESSDGALVGHVDFGQPLRAAPLVNDRGDRIYVAAEHSILYTLSTEDFSCVGVFYSGHARGAISVPPATVLNKVIVADNSGTEMCRLRVLSIDPDGAINGEIASERLTGLVITPMARAGRRLAAATTVGQIAVVEISGADDATALSVVARREGNDPQPTARFALIHEGRLWLAATQLTALEILPTEGQLSVRSLDQDFNGDAFDGALQAVGPLVVHVRRPAGRAGVVVAATDATANRVAWQTEIAVPVAGAPVVDGSKFRVLAVNASGAVFDLDRTDLGRQVDDAAERADAPLGDERPLTTSIDLGGGRLAAAAPGGTRLLHAASGSSSPTVKTFELPSPLSCPLSLWNDQLVVPTDDGRVTLHDAATGAVVGTPFLPELTPNRKVHWLAPATTGEGDESQLVITDGADTLYRLALESEPTPHIAAESGVDVGPSPLISPLFATQTHVFAGTEDGRLASYSLPDLKPDEPVELGGRIVWGPHDVGEGMLLATDADELMLIDADGTVRWRQELKHGACGGAPLVADGSALVLYSNGGVARVALTDGTEGAYSDLGQPAVAGPVALGERLLVVGPDGSLLVLNRP